MSLFDHNVAHVHNGTLRLPPGAWNHYEVRTMHNLWRAHARAMAMVGLVGGLVAPAAAGTAKGTVTYKTARATIAHASLVRGPDAVDGTQTIRRLVLSAVDLESKITACAVMSCSDGEVGEGLTLDLGAGPRVNYWVSLKGQRLQYSGTAEPTTLQTTVDEPSHMVGRFVVDATAAGGPGIDVRFDAVLLKEFHVAR